MRTRIGNWENDLVTRIYPRYDRAHGYCISRRQARNALARMDASPSARLRVVPVAGVWLAENDLTIWSEVPHG